MRSQVPFGTEIHASASLSTFTWPAQAFLLVPQSFLPALTMPAHFSVSPLEAKAWEAPAARPTARRLAKADWTMRSVVFMTISITVERGSTGYVALTGCIQYRDQTSRNPHGQLNLWSRSRCVRLGRQREIHQHARLNCLLQELCRVE